MTKCEICNKKSVLALCDKCALNLFDQTRTEENYKTPEFKDMIMTYSDKTLGESK